MRKRRPDCRVGRYSSRLDSLPMPSLRLRFSPTAGTMFHQTHLGLGQWFPAIYLMGSSEEGISAVQLKTYLGVSYETARNMVRRIRQAIAQDKHLVQRFLQIPEPQG
jgi:hypothetical protein